MGIVRLIGLRCNKSEVEKLRGSTSRVGRRAELGGVFGTSPNPQTVGWQSKVYRSIPAPDRNSVQQRCRRIPGAACRCSETKWWLCLCYRTPRTPIFSRMHPRESWSDPCARLLDHRSEILTPSAEKHVIMLIQTLYAS